MSLRDFPSIPTEATTHEAGCTIGTHDVASSSLLVGYPPIERTHLMGLKHSLSRDDVRTVFLRQDDSVVARMWNIWLGAGTMGVLRYIASLEPTSEVELNSGPGAYSISVITARKLLTVAKMLENVAIYVLPTKVIKCTEDVISENSNVLNWKSNWIRSVCWHEQSNHLAVCQRNDSIRLFFNVGLQLASHKAPITLRHSEQKNVSDMTFIPYSNIRLVVAADSCVLIWNLDPSSLTNRPAPSCAQVVQVECVPVTQLLCNNTGTTLLFSSPTSSSIMLYDWVSSSTDRLTSELGDGRVVKLILAADSSKLLVAYDNCCIRVYVTCDWRLSECWTQLKGRCVAAVWSADSSQLLFCTAQSTHVYAASFGLLLLNGVTRLGGSASAVPVFDLSAVELSMVDSVGDITSDTVTVGGVVWDIQLSPDGRRLAVLFRDNPGYVALFVVTWKPMVLLTPCGFVHDGQRACAEMIRFQPYFGRGSLLSVVWSSGKLQYFPILYTDVGETGVANRRGFILNSVITDGESPLLFTDDFN